MEISILIYFLVLSSVESVIAAFLFNLILLSTVCNLVDSTKYKTTTNNNNAKLQFSLTKILLSQ